MHPKMSAFRTERRATVIKHQWSPSADLFSGRHENENASHKMETNDRDAVNYVHLKRQTRKAEKHFSMLFRIPSVATTWENGLHIFPG